MKHSFFNRLWTLTKKQSLTPPRPTLTLSENVDILISENSISSKEAHMLKRVMKRVFISFAAIALLLVVGVLTLGALSGGSCGSVLATGRVVNAQSDSWYVTSSSSHDTATIQTAGRTIEVGPTDLRVDGQLVTTVDSSVKSVDVIVKGGAISFIADGRTVGACPR
jgi:hypothetical protein